MLLVAYKVDENTMLRRQKLESTACDACIRSEPNQAPIQRPVSCKNEPLKLTHAEMTGKISDHRLVELTTF